VQAGCCTDKCKELAKTQTDCFALTNPTEKEAGCTGDDTDGDCFCSWNYQGDKSTANGCTNEGTADSPTWKCDGASDYDTNGECQDPFEILGEVIGAVGVGLGAALVTTPPTPTPKRLLPAYTFSVRFDLSEGRHSGPPLST
jgi:hypothetical protein